MRRNCELKCFDVAVACLRVDPLCMEVLSSLSFKGCPKKSDK